MWPFSRKRQSADAASELQSLVQSEQPRQANAHGDAPAWVAKLIRFLVAKWPTLLSLLLMIVEDSTKRMSLDDKIDSGKAIDLLRRTTSDNPTAVAMALEAK